MRHLLLLSIIIHVILEGHSADVLLQPEHELTADELKFGRELFEGIGMAIIGVTPNRIKRSLDNWQAKEGTSRVKRGLMDAAEDIMHTGSVAGQIIKSQVKDEVVGTLEDAKDTAKSSLYPLPDGVKNRVVGVLDRVVPTSDKNKPRRRKGSLRSRTAGPLRRSAPKPAATTTTEGPQEDQTGDVIRGSRNKKFDLSHQ